MAIRSASWESRRRSPPASPWLETEPLEMELRRIALLTVDELRAFWPTRFPGHPPSAFARDMLARLIAWRIQAERLGGLDPGTSKLLARLANGHAEPVRRFGIGTVLVREYRGTTHEVVVVAGGFLWNGTVHGSLSTIARAITGTAWNGPRFFGLRDEREGDARVSRRASRSDRPSPNAMGRPAAMRRVPGSVPRSGGIERRP